MEIGDTGMVFREEGSAKTNRKLLYVSTLTRAYRVVRKIVTDMFMKGKQTESMESRREVTRNSSPTRVAGRMKKRR